MRVIYFPFFLLLPPPRMAEPMAVRIRAMRVKGRASNPR